MTAVRAPCWRQAVGAGVTSQCAPCYPGVLRLREAIDFFPLLLPRMGSDSRRLVANYPQSPAPLAPGAFLPGKHRFWICQN